MRFSTKAEYGLKAMVNLAQNYPQQKTSKEISAVEEISVKYLERLLGVLGQSGLINGQKGKSGGYALARSPKTIRVGEIVEVLEGPISPMRCVGHFCAAEKHCSSSKVWNLVGEQINKTLHAIKLSDLI